MVCGRFLQNDVPFFRAETARTMVDSGRRRKGGGHACAALRCSNSQYKRDCRGKSFYRFPADEKRCDLWVQNLGRDDLLNEETRPTYGQLYNNFRLCSDHFEDSQFTNPEKKRLVWNAVPTLFYVSNHPRPVTGKKRPLPHKRSEPPAKKLKVGAKIRLGRMDGQVTICDFGPRDMEISLSSEDDSDSMKKTQKQKTEKEPEQLVCSITVGTPGYQLSADLNPFLHKSAYTSATLPSLNKSHVCQRCSTAFVMFNSLRVHMVTFHGENLHTELPASSTSDSCSGDGGGGSDVVDFDQVVKREVTIKEEDGDENIDKQVCYHGDDGHVKYIKEEANSDDENTDEEVGYPGDEREVKIKDEGNDDDDNIEKRVCYYGDEGEVKSVKEECNFYEENTDQKVDDHGDERGVKIKDEGNDADENTDKKVGYHEDKNIQELDICGKRKEVGRKKDKVGDDNTNKRRLAKKVKRHECDVCSKAFARASFLKKHKLFHAGHKPFVCDICDKAFIQSGDLKRHMLIHTGHKPFPCDMCTKAFSTAGNLKTHKLFHAGRKQFLCNICDKAFTQSGDFKRHMLIHTDHRPFPGNIHVHKDFYNS